MNIEHNKIVKRELVRRFCKAIYANTLQFDVIVMGRSGVGKSSTVNSIVGYPASKVDEYQMGTTEILSFQHEYDGLQIRITDTPGLCDNLESEQDAAILQEIKQNFRSPFCLVYVTEIDATRVASGERRAINQISRAFGKNIWSRSVIVFSGADRLPKKTYGEVLATRSRLIKETIVNSSEESVRKELRTLAISNRSPRLPDGSLWQIKLYTQILEKLIVHPSLQRLKEEYTKAV